MRWLRQTNTTAGAVSYLAIYIGFVLVIACAAILAIQQLSGVSDASRSYRVLSELGCDKRQIAHSMLAQQTVFFMFPARGRRRPLARGAEGRHRPRQVVRRPHHQRHGGLHRVIFLAHTVATSWSPTP